VLATLALINPVSSEDTQLVEIRNQFSDMHFRAIQIDIGLEDK